MNIEELANLYDPDDEKGSMLRVFQKCCPYKIVGALGEYLEPLHNETLNQISETLGIKVQKCILVYGLIPYLGMTNPTAMPIIVVHPNIWNLPIEQTPVKSFQSLLSHEYGHRIFDDRFRDSVDELERSKMLTGAHETGEGFAFWLQRTIMGTELTEEVLSPFQESGQDIMQIKKVYHQLLKQDPRELMKGLNFYHAICRK